MQAYDNKVLWDRLNELADVFEKKPVSEKALTVWFGVLKEFPTERIAGVLIAWPRSHTKFPTPAEVWKACNDIGVREREAKAEKENKEEFHPGIGGAQAEKFIAKMRETLKRPKWTPREHWERLALRAKPGSIGARYAAKALKKMGHGRSREPGEDDEPLPLSKEKLEIAGQA